MIRRPPRSTLFLHDALPISDGLDNKTVARRLRASLGMVGKWRARFLQARLEGLYDRSEEHTSELQSHSDLVCRLLLEKKNNCSPSGDETDARTEPHRRFSYR